MTTSVCKKNIDLYSTLPQKTSNVLGMLVETKQDCREETA